MAQQTQADFVCIGAAVPDITLPDLDGNAHSLAQHRGKRLLVFMWASW